MIGDLVYTRNGLRRVLNSGLSDPNAPLWKLRMTDGTALIGTGDHPVWSETRGEFVKLQFLRPSDILLQWSENFASIPPDAASLSGTESSGISLRGTGRTVGDDHYIKQSIEDIRDQFRKGLRSITGTGTLPITNPLTFLPSLIRSIGDFTPGDLLSGLVSSGLKPLLSNGESEGLDPLAAILAEPNSSLKARERSSVYPVQKRGEPRLGVDTVRDLNLRGPVYNLTVEDTPEFFANGILVHNCDEIAAWMYPEKAWDNLIMGLRLGAHPQVFWTGTPKPKPFIRTLVKLKKSIVVDGSTYENAENLTDIFYENVAKYEGTTIGRQELWGEILDPEEAGFVKRSQWRLWPANRPLPRFRFIIMSLDTAFTERTWDKKEQTSDYTACTVWGLFGYERKDHIMLLDAWQDRLGMPELIRRVKIQKTYTYGDADEPALRPQVLSKDRRAAHQGRPADLILIEEKGSGISLRQMLAVENILTQSYNPGRMDKLSRLHAVSPCFPNGRVWALESERPDRKGNAKSWAESVISQFCSYVGEGSLEHDDLLDTGTQALLFLMHRFDMKFTVRPNSNEEAARILESVRKRKGRRNPYGG